MNSETVTIAIHNTYCSLLDDAGILETDNLPTGRSGTVLFYLNGAIYNQDLGSLLYGFEEQGADFVRRIEGSFIIFLVLNSRIFVLTDNFNSKKAYYSISRGCIKISTDVDRLPDSQKELSIKGVASYISNGSMMNDLTVFEDIRSFPRASVSTFREGRLQSVVYNPYSFRYDEEPQYEQLKKQLQDVIVECVAKRYSTPRNPVLSLSAGWDARGILGVLGEALSVDRLETFSYASSYDPKPNTDAGLSKELAATYGFKHQIVKSYEGDIVQLIRNNANHGKGIAYFCYELDSWLALEKQGEYSDLFVGDEIFGWINVVIESEENVLDSIEARRASSIKWLKSYIPAESFEQLSIALDESLHELYSRADSFENWHDKKDFLYLDHRVSNVLMPWRELISSKIGTVHNPYIDGKVLEFMQQVPPSLRKNKSLFRDAISELFPELFEMPRATNTGHGEDWRREVLKAKDELVEIIESTDSALDVIVPKSGIIALINDQNRRFERFAVFTVKVINYFRKRNTCFDRLSSMIIGKRAPRTDSNTVLLRILALRTYLIKEQPVGAWRKGS